MRIDGAITGATGITPLQASGTVQPGGDSFSASLRQQLDELSGIHEEASRMQEAFAAGQLTDINEVVLAVQKADLALNFALQVRNKVVEAYQEITRMQV